ncbi:hypothetical protein [Elizabethkingia sp. JS20170427COW]|uniref:hypothetical protein n=1 Tax=Elizabethkingia sp. JS20170427COW TaxID=2583851 RepID=UPI00143D1CF7|nr:hypothetical protein [Elizabethkingia sp. JS20170427COW]
MEQNKTSNNRFWKLLLPSLLLFLTAWFLWKQCHRNQAENTITSPKDTLSHLVN